TGNDAVKGLNGTVTHAAPDSAVTVERAAPPTFAHIETLFSEWLYGDDREPARAMLAAYVANRHLDGDAVWLMLVGGSGVGKTERLQTLSALPDVVMASSISGPAALLSATVKKERAAN